MRVDLKDFLIPDCPASGRVLEKESVTLPASTAVSVTDLALMAWLLMSSAYAFCIFGWDKRRSRGVGKSRVPEKHLLLASALGGWPGAVAAMLMFRHKTAKPSFLVKFTVAFLIWAGLLFAYGRERFS